MTEKTEKKACRTPTKGRYGVVNIDAWKFELLRSVILDVVADAGANGFPFAGLSATIKSRLNTDQLERLGSVGWHATTVKLEMEVAGDISRLPNVSPQRLIIANDAYHAVPCGIA